MYHLVSYSNQHAHEMISLPFLLFLHAGECVEKYGAEFSSVDLDYKSPSSSPKRGGGGRFLLIPVPLVLLTNFFFF